MRASFRSLAALALLPALVACGSKTVPPPAGQKGNQIQYKPDGCSYTVTSVVGGQNAQYLNDKTPATLPPRHVHASFASDPSTSFAVNWESEPTGKTTPPAYLTQLYYGTSQSAVQAATGAGTGVTVQNGHTVDFASTLDPGTVTRVHEVHVCGLTPATTYYYKVGNSGAFSSVYSLVTAPAAGSTAPIRFAVSGDARSTPDTWDQAQKAIQAAGPTFQMFTGDAINFEYQQEWDAFFEDNSAGVVASDVMAEIPIMTADGNHEGLGVNYLAQFALPQQPGGGEPPGSGQLDSTKQWYSFTYGNAHFVVLNDTTLSGDTIAGSEKTWLQNDLAAVNRTTTPWILVFHHQPEYSNDSVHGSDATLQQAWGPVFDANHVDVVINGHVHNYQRTQPLNNGSVASQAAGTTYIVAAGVGAPLYSVGLASGQFQVCQEVENYLIVNINGMSLDIKAYQLDTGAQIDELTINKGG